MENLTAIQKEQDLKNFEIKQNRRLLIGKIIVLMTIISSILIVFIDLIIFNNFNFLNIFDIVANVIFSLLLYLGIVWIKYLFVVFAAYNLYNIVVLFLNLLSYKASLGALIFVSFIILYNFSVCILLLINKYVQEFLYSQKYK